MNVLTHHRGPDDNGMFVSSMFSLGNNRLAIIDLSPGGHQPMINDDGTLAIVYNGELFNYKEICDELKHKGFQFRSQSDTEVLLKAYEAWGSACLQKLNGIFAFAVLHVHENKLFFARDRLGVNPFYYYHAGGRFIFSSEIKGIFAHRVPRDLDVDALNMYFRLLYVPSPKTIWQNIFKLPPAHYGILENGQLHLERYWNVVHGEELHDREEIKHEIKRLVDDAVRLQLVSDRPVGVFLSGGIDSTAVVGAMSALGGNVETFSVGFEKTEEAEKYNRDFELARKTAAYFGTTHHEFVLSAHDVQTRFEKALWHMDEPVSNHIQAVNLFLAEQTARYVTVALGGDGGDEVWGGYDRYYLNQLIDRLRRMPAWVRHSAVKAVLHARNKDDWYQKLETAPGVDRYFEFWGQKESTVASFLRPDFNRTNVTKIFFAERYFQNIWSDFTKQMMAVDLQTWLPDESLVRSNKMSMAASLEQRVPLLDHRLVELGFRVPTQYKIAHKGHGKDIFIEALQEYLPAHVLGQTKWGWFSPAAKWLRTDLNAYAREVLSPSYNQETRDFFDFEAIQRMFEDHCSKKQYNLNALWLLMTFQVWYNTFKVQL